MTDDAATRLFQALLAARRAGGDGTLGDALDMLAGATKEGRYQFASNVIRGGAKAGRHRLDDQAEIEEIRRLMDEGHSRGAAIGIVARANASPAATVESLARRYRGRLKKAG